LSSNTNKKIDTAVLIDGENRSEDTEWAGLSQTMKIYIDKHVVTSVESSKLEVRKFKKEAIEMNLEVQAKIE